MTCEFGDVGFDRKGERRFQQWILASWEMPRHASIERVGGWRLAQYLTDSKENQSITACLRVDDSDNLEGPCPFQCLFDYFERITGARKSYMRTMTIMVLTWVSMLVLWITYYLWYQYLVYSLGCTISVPT